MKSTIYLFMAVALVAAVATWGRSAQPESENAPAERVMHVKLGVSKSVLAALAERDYGQIKEGAEALAQLARSAAWDATRSKSYERSSVEFERSAYHLAQAADQQNYDAAILAFFNMTFACVNCHEHLRDQNRPAGGRIAAVLDKLPDHKDQDLTFWMKKKLEFSETALTAICVADFDSLIEASQRMSRLSKVEGWARRTDAREYRTALADFEKANQDLRRAAENKSADSAAMAFTNLTLSCVRCHSTLRQQASAEDSR